MRTIYFILITCCFQSISAQGVFSLSIDSSFQEHQGIDLTQNNLWYKFDAEMKNIGDSILNVGWSAFDIQNCPSEWNLVISDKYIEYILATNFDYAIAIDLAPEEEAPYNFIISHNGVPGCCSISVQFYDAENPAMIFDTSYYELKLNVENCTVTNTVDSSSKNEIQIHPIPASSKIHISTSVPFISGEIFSINGNKIMNLDANQNDIQINTFDSGMYLIILKDSNQKKTISTFIKN